jgi:hypothetical protein
MSAPAMKSAAAKCKVFCRPYKSATGPEMGLKIRAPREVMDVMSDLSHVVRCLPRGKYDGDEFDKASNVEEMIPVLYTH